MKGKIERKKRIKRRIGVLVVVGIFFAMAFVPITFAQDLDKKEWSDGSYIIDIDKDDDEIDRIFKVSKHDEGTELFRIQENGRVGIGTANPHNLLDIEKQGTAKSNLDIFHITNSANAADMDGTETSILFNQYYYHASPLEVDVGRIAVGTETDWLGLASTQDGYMAFHTVKDGSVSEKVRITSDGNVGIGTTGTDVKLEVADSSNAQLRLTHTDAIKYTDIQTDGNGYLYINPSGGRVGIRQNSPEADLHIGQMEAPWRTPGSADRIAISTYSHYESWIIEVRDTSPQAYLDLRIGSADKLTITGMGYVGIGTTEPVATLHIVQHYPSNRVFVVDDEVADTTPFQIHNDGKVGIGVPWNYNNKLDINGNVAIGASYAGQYWKSAPANGMIVEGKVGIGTSDPVPTLDVNGGFGTYIVTKYYTDDGYTPTTSDYTILVDASGATTEDVDIELPAASGRQRQILVIKRIDDTTCGYDVKINADGSETIDESPSKTLDTQWQSIMIQSDGFNWYILASKP
jgi:hypothetical protein